MDRRVHHWISMLPFLVGRYSSIRTSEKGHDKGVEMNQDEVISLVTKLVVAGFGSYLGQQGFDVTQLPGAIGAIGTLVGIGYGVYTHWNMKKVPETSTVIPNPHETH
jgi:hypothetical protein